MSDALGYVQVREAAIALFAERGVAGTSVLDIASVAGVSGGLIRHHFGSKEQLREACDQHVFAEVVQFKTGTLARMQQDPTYRPRYDDRILRYYRYLGRATMDGSAQALRHFDRIVAETERWLVEESGQEYADPRAVAVVLTAHSVGMTALLDTMAAALDLGTEDAAFMERVAAASALIYTDTVVPPGLAARFREMAQQVTDERVDPGSAAATDSAQEGR